MTLIPIRWSPRRKAVWGPKRTLAILSTLALMVFGLAPNALAAGSSHKVSQKKAHHQVARKAKPGRPNSSVKAYKLDNEMTRRSTSFARCTRRA